MSKHFPKGGKVRIEPKIPTDTEKNMRISKCKLSVFFTGPQGTNALETFLTGENIAHAESKLNSIIAIQSKEGCKATIERNQAFKGAKLISAITDDPGIFKNIDFN